MMAKFAKMTKKITKKDNDEEDHKKDNDEEDHEE